MCIFCTPLEVVPCQWTLCIFRGFVPPTLDVSLVLTTFVEGIFGAIQQHHVRIDPAYASLLLSCLMMEAIANQCDPTMDVVSYIRGLVADRQVCIRQPFTSEPIRGVTS